MTIRNVIVLVVGLLCLTAVCAVVAQHRQLVDLRAGAQRLMAESQRLQTSPALQTPEASPSLTPSSDVSRELLRLRGEVGVLTRRRRELEGVEKENERLRLQMASASPNNPSGLRLPPGYIRKNQAQMAGYDTPENTLQTFLWAMANHNVQATLDSFSPPIAQKLAAEIPAGESSNFFQEADTTIAGLGVIDRKNLPDGTMELTIEMVPGIHQSLRFERLNGQWKIASPGL